MSKKQEDELLNRARLGIEAEQFLRSSIGKYLMERSDELIDIETNKLIQCDSSDLQANIDARNGIQIGALIQQWLTDAVDEGQIAQYEINEIDATS